MRTKNWYVFTMDEGVYGVSPQSYTSVRKATKERANCIRYGYPVSPIVKITMPLPEAKP